MHWTEVEYRRLKKEGFKYGAHFQVGGGMRSPETGPIGFMKLQDLWELPYITETLIFYKNFSNDRYEIHLGPLISSEFQTRFIFCRSEKVFSPPIGWFYELTEAFNDDEKNPGSSTPPG